MNLTFCIKCGKELPECAQFCSICGKKTQINMNKRNELPITEIIGSSFKPSMNVANFLIVFLPMVLFL